MSASNIERQKEETSTAERQHQQVSSDCERRDFLRKVGKFAVYTPPAVLALMYFDGNQNEAAASNLPRVRRRRRRRWRGRP